MKRYLNTILLKNDSTKKMARAISRGVESSGVANSIIRTVDSDHYKDTDDMLVTKEDLQKLFWYDNWKPDTFWKYGCTFESFLY